MRSLIKHNRSGNYIQNLQEEMDRIMEDTFGSLSLFGIPMESKLWRPPVEMSETVNNYKIKLQLPGFDQKDINVEVGADYITVKAQNSFEKEIKDKNLYKSEFRYGNFMRTVSFPEKINADKAKVEYKNGVLNIDLEKMNLKELKKKSVKSVEKKAQKAPRTLAKKRTVAKKSIKK